MQLVRYIQVDSKRWTQLRSNRRLNTRQTVCCSIPSSLLAQRVDLRGLRSKFSWIRLTFFSDTRGRPELLPLHRQPIRSNWFIKRQMLFLLGGWTLKRRRNARCTAVGDLVLMNSTRKILCCIVAILLSTDAAARFALGDCSGDIWNYRASSFKCYVDRSHNFYISGNIDVQNWVHLFESRSILYHFTKH